MRKQHLLSLLFICFVLAVNAQFDQMPKTIPLESDDLDRIIETYKPMKADFEGLGEEFGKYEGAEGFKKALANEKVQKIFDKHGWDGEEWFGKFMTITMAYGMITMEKELSKMSDEDRKQAEQFQGPYLTQMKSMVAEDDLKSVRDRFAEIGEVLIEQ